MIREQVHNPVLPRQRSQKSGTACYIFFIGIHAFDQREYEDRNRVWLLQPSGDWTGSIRSGHRNISYARPNPSASNRQGEARNYPSRRVRSPAGRTASYRQPDVSPVPRNGVTSPVTVRDATTALLRKTSHLPPNDPWKTISFSISFIKASAEYSVPDISIAKAGHTSAQVPHRVQRAPSVTIPSGVSVNACSGQASTHVRQPMHFIFRIEFLLPAGDSFRIMAHTHDRGHPFIKIVNPDNPARR